jgi:hypothetical protein
MLSEALQGNAKDQASFSNVSDVFPVAIDRENVRDSSLSPE